MSRIMRLMAVLIGLLGILPEAAIASGTSNQSLILLKKFIPGCGKYHGEELLSKKLCTSLKDKICTVRNHPGGCFIDFDEIYHYILAENIKVRFEGSIKSSPALLAMALTLRPGSACVGRDVVFKLHQAWTPGPNSKEWGDEFGVYTPNLYPPLILQWVRNQPGGEPASATRFLLMPYSVAQDFFQTCPNMDVVSR